MLPKYDEHLAQVQCVLYNAGGDYLYIHSSSNLRVRWGGRGDASCQVKDNAPP